MNGYLGEFFDGLEEREEAEYAAQDWIVEFLSHYMLIDGAHHKQWLLDQIARISMGTPVVFWESRWEGGHTELRFKTGEPSQKYLDWRGEDWHEEDEGISP